MSTLLFFFFFQAEDGIRDLVRSRGLGDVYKRQEVEWHYMEDDEDMHDAGNDYADMLELPFKMISYQHISK